MEGQSYIPKDKHDVAAVHRAKRAGFPKLNSVLHELLEWIQDANWPVAREAAKLLSKAGIEIVPHIEVILNSDDDIWKYWVIELVVRNQKTEIRKMLRGNLVRIAKYPTVGERLEEVDLSAKSVLAI